MISKTLREKLSSQADQEIAFARLHKRPKVTNWHLNENLFYGVKPANTDSRANIDLGRMQEFVSTYLSKIDNPLKFKFTKRKDSQLQRVRNLNALRDRDAAIDFWDLKDLAGKVQMLLYGRAIYTFYAESDTEYCAHLENVDVYDFLIDPSSGGLDPERARYMGRYGVVKDASELKQGDYITSVIKEMLAPASSSVFTSQEDVDKKNRRIGTLTTTETEITDGDKFKFWEWFTTYEGERYYLLKQENGKVIRCEKLVDLFPASKAFPLGAWPFWTYAAMPNLTEFWTPAPADQVRDIFMTQNITINQMVDNGEEHNKPMKVVDVSAVENLAELKYRKGGTIRTKSGYDVGKAIQFMRPPAIETPLQVFDKLESIQEKASGLTAGSKGVESAGGKVGIYEGNQANAADRFGLINKMYSMGNKRFAALYELGVRQHLTKKVAVDILGPDGIETRNISKRDIFRKDDEFSVMVDATDAEEQASEVDKRNKLTFLSQNVVNPIQSPKKSYEFGAKIAGFTTEEIKELLDTSEYGNAEVLAECSRDIEDLLSGKLIKPNRNANNAYKQRFVDYLSDHEEDMSHEQFMVLSMYLQSCEEFIMANTVREMNTKISNMGAPPAPGQSGGAPLQPTGVTPPDPYGQPAGQVPAIGA